MKVLTILIMTLLALPALSKKAQKNDSSGPSAKIEKSEGSYIPAGFIKLENVSSRHGDGVMFLDPVSCQVKMKVERLYVSLDNGNFQVQFPDGRTVIGKIQGTSAKGDQPCFHSLPEEKPVSKDPHYIWANYPSYDNTPGGLARCKSGEKTNITDTLTFLSEKEYKSNCKETPDCRSRDNKLRIVPGLGLVLFLFNKNLKYGKDGKVIRNVAHDESGKVTYNEVPPAAFQYGSNIKTSDLQIDPKMYISKCNPKATSGTPGALAPAPAASKPAQQQSK
jgi:hypothetical protein